MTVRGCDSYRGVDAMAASDGLLEKEFDDDGVDMPKVKEPRDEEARGRNATRLAKREPLLHDADVEFDEPTHEYTVFGRIVAKSTTAIKAQYFDHFDADATIDKLYSMWKTRPGGEYHNIIWTVIEAGGSDADAKAAIKLSWEQANQLGTTIHAYIEFDLNGDHPDPEAAEYKDVRTEIEQYHAWKRDANVVIDAHAEVEEVAKHHRILVPVRTELSVFDATFALKPHTAALREGRDIDRLSPDHVVRCAGQIDGLMEILRDASESNGYSELPLTFTHADVGKRLYHAPFRARELEEPERRPLMLLTEEQAENTLWGKGFVDDDAAGIMRYPNWRLPYTHDPFDSVRGCDIHSFSEGAVITAVEETPFGAVEVRSTLAGQQDGTLTLRNLPQREFEIWDWKRVKSKKRLDKAAMPYQGATGKGPFACHYDTDHVKYSLQQSMYEVQLLRNSGMCLGPPGESRCNLLRVHCDRLAGYEEVRCTDLSREAKLILLEEGERLLAERQSSEARKRKADDALT
jgi:hypothetical protein